MKFTFWFEFGCLNLQVGHPAHRSRVLSKKLVHKIDAFWILTSNLKITVFLRIRAFQKGAFQPYYANPMLQNNVFAIWSKNHKKSQIFPMLCTLSIFLAFKWISHVIIIQSSWKLAHRCKIICSSKIFQQNLSTRSSCWLNDAKSAALMTLCQKFIKNFSKHFFYQRSAFCIQKYPLVHTVFVAEPHFNWIKLIFKS